MANEWVEDVFWFIVEYKEANDGNSPTLREIGEAVGISSNSVVKYQLDKLAEDGRIRYQEAGQARGIVVSGGCWFYAHPRRG